MNTLIKLIRRSEYLVTGKHNDRLKIK